MKYRLLNKDEITNVLNTLTSTYPVPKCGLDYTNPFELLISLILAAQCTDLRVNQIRPILTSKYPTPKDIANIDKKDIYDVIKSCSFPNNKASHILEASKKLVNEYNSKVPNTMKELVTIPGIGRKSANIILAECFGIIEGIAVDTHVTRLSQKIGFTNNTDALKIEKDLMKRIPKKSWGYINHTLVEHGKTICIARRPKCDICPISNICREYRHTHRI